MVNLVVEDSIEDIRKNRYNGSDNKFHCELENRDGGKKHIPWEWKE